MRLDVVGVAGRGLVRAGRSRRGTLIAAAEVLIGGRRHLDLVPADAGRSERLPWPSPLRPALPGLLEDCAGRRTVVLASGDPLVSGIGSTLIDLLGADAVRIHPAVSSVALARARLGWASETVRVVTVVGRDLDLVRRHLGAGAAVDRAVVGRRDARRAGRLLVDAGYGPSALTVLGDLGTDLREPYADDRRRRRADRRAGPQPRRGRVPARTPTRARSASAPGCPTTRTTTTAS